MNILIWQALPDKEKLAALQRPTMQDDELLQQNTQKIIDEVKAKGDDALRSLSATFDKVMLTQIQASTAAFDDSVIANDAKKAIDTAYQNIHTFHAAQQYKPIRVETQKGIICEKIARPIQKVGLYIPGGSAPLISTALMLGVPSQIAGCPSRVMCTPPGKSGAIDPHILYAAKLCEIETVYQIGGAQAIAAMAYGTETVLKVDKIFGPGNAYVTKAKQIVAHDPKGCSIDLPAGPSEVMVIADNAANPQFVASDLLSQAEHGADSQSVLICFSESFANKVLQAVTDFTQNLSRKTIIEASLKHSNIIVVEDMMQAIMIANHYAPEHLIIQVENAREYLPKLTCAGSIFLGAYAPESVGDYASGTNHVLPTYGYARNHSGLGLMDFMVYMSVQELTPSALQQLAPTVQTLAMLEGLDAHALAISTRLQDLQ